VLANASCRLQFVLSHYCSTGIARCPTRIAIVIKSLYICVSHIFCILPHPLQWHLAVHATLFFKSQSERKICTTRSSQNKHQRTVAHPYVIPFTLKALTVKLPASRLTASASLHLVPHARHHPQPNRLSHLH
jgi:hypothetical protein